MVLIVAIGCSAPLDPQTTLVLDYHDFGPQAMSYDVLGYAWWQWQSQGGPDPRTRHKIHVVVYRGISREEVARRYPVVRERRQDYRYIESAVAMRYLDEKLREMEAWRRADPETYSAELDAKLRTTKKMIHERLKAKGAGH